MNTVTASSAAAGPASVTAERIPVLYIGGSGRSGSTLIERVVGQLPGVVPVGELVFLWSRGIREDRLCGCGERFHACAFWQRIGEEAFGGWDRVDLDEVLALQARLDRSRFIPQMLARGASPGYRRDLTRYAEYLLPVYRAARSTSGAGVLVDSSKHASTAFLLGCMGGLDLRVLHLVRDSRGVAYSWTKQVRKPGTVEGEPSHMPRFHPGRQSLYWVAFNLMFEALPVSGVPTMRLRYESFLREPRTEVERVARFGGLEFGDDAFGFLDEREVELVANHSVSGNPMRFATGRLELRLDDAWRREMPRRQAALVSGVTAPLRWRYGYR